MDVQLIERSVIMGLASRTFHASVEEILQAELLLHPKLNLGSKLVIRSGLNKIQKERSGTPL